MVRQRVIWSSRAKLDLFEILNFYYKRNGSKTYSFKLNSSFRQALKLLEKYPQLGVQTDIPAIRILIEANFAIFYEIRPGQIEISSIWDCRQSPESLKLTERL